VRLWGRDAEQVERAARARENERYLPGAVFPDTLTPVTDLAAALDGAGIVLVAVPSHGLRETLSRLAPRLDADVRICWATKGFELTTGKLPHQVVAEELGDKHPLAVLSGPTFAREVGEGLPTAMTIAANDDDFAAALAAALSDDTFRAYTSTDMIGVEVGGAVKNVLAIGAGISDGLGFGANTRIAMISRGLVEMTRLGIALGARQETFMGLAGMGDLVLTCTDDQSRNRRMGLMIAAGRPIEVAQKEIGQVVEGVLAARAVHQVAAASGVEMPICEQVYAVLYEGKPAKDAVRDLMRRSLKPEQD